MVFLGRWIEFIQREFKKFSWSSHFDKRRINANKNINELSYHLHDSRGGIQLSTEDTILCTTFSLGVLLLQANETLMPNKELFPRTRTEENQQVLEECYTTNVHCTQWTEWSFILKVLGKRPFLRSAVRTCHGCGWKCYYRVSVWVKHKPESLRYRSR